MPDSQSRRETEIASAQAWLAADQYEHGEWGKCESSDPTSDPRTLDSSRLKPMLFVSSQAALALCATGFLDSRPTTRFFDWLEKLREKGSGYWTSAGGAQVPMGGNRGWSEVKNIRHTAKAIDLLLLCERFTAGDSAILADTLAHQQPDGSFPQHPGAPSDLWSTAYAINMLIRASHRDNIRKSIPRGVTEEEWAIQLRNRLERARSWMCDRISGSLWHVDGKDPVWVSEAVLAEIGADLSIHRKDVSNQVAKTLLESEEQRGGQTYWALLLVLHILRPELQRQVIQALSDWSRIDLIPGTYDMACSLRAFWLKDTPQLASYLVRHTNGHESLLARWSAWNRDEYMRWCVAKAKEFDLRLTEDNLVLPADKAECWTFVATLLQEFKYQVEHRGMWRLLSDENGSLRAESAIQTAFWNVANPLARNRGVLSREPTTGRGPVDFEFCNGSRAKVLIEFKRGGSSDPIHGLEKQLPTYMDAEGADSAILVLVGNTESHRNIYSKLESAASAIQSANADRFICTFYIDASKKVSASSVE